ncbi:MAG: LacI family DNA-binding transcriptional regulator [Anaerolineales bacterium]
MSTLQEIADRVGVSVATVSRALNDKPGVGADTRQRIIDAAQAVEYFPNLAARSLATSRTQSVLFIIHRRRFLAGEDPFYPYIMQGLEQALTSEGYAVMPVTLSASQLEGSLASIPAIQQRRPAAIVLAGPDISSPFIVAASASGLPTILVDNASRETSILAVLPGNEEGCKRATMHLIEAHNHSDIALLRGPPDWVSSEERTDGYLAAMKAAGMEPSIMAADDTTIETGQETTRHVLEARPDTTAIVAINDAMAIGALRAARQMGREVPKDLAITGFDDIAWAAYSDPPLTTVKVPTIEMGRLAGRLLIDRMAGSLTEISRTRVDTRLIIRESCGCHPKESGE